MWKFAGGGIGAAICAFSFFNGISRGIDLGSSSSRSASGQSVEEELASAAVEIRQKRGFSQRGVTFVDARVQRRTLVIEYTIAHVPRGASMINAADRAQEMMKDRFCHGRIARVLREGGAIELTYSNANSGRHLFDVRLDAGVCRL